MNVKLQRYLYVLSLAGLICGIVLHVIARTEICKRESQQAQAISNAIQKSYKYVEPNDASIQKRLVLIRTSMYCGHIFICAGIAFSILWFYLGGRSGVWVMLLLLLIDAPIWMF